MTIEKFTDPPEPPLPLWVRLASFGLWAMALGALAIVIGVNV